MTSYARIQAIRRALRSVSPSSEWAAVMADDYGLLVRWKLAQSASRDRRLSRTDLAVMMAILDRIDDATGIAWPGLKRIAIDANADRSSVVRSLGRITECGYLLRESGDRTKSNRYRMGRCEVTPSCEATPRRAAAPTGRCELAPGVGANLRLGVGANSHPELAYKNPPIEPTQLNPLVSGFAEFYAAYPNKVSGAKAAAAWRSKRLDAEAEAILADVKASTALGGRWSNTDRKFIPHPTTYLNGRRWEDEWAPTHVVPLTGRLPRDTRSEDELEAANLAGAARFARASA